MKRWQYQREGSDFVTDSYMGGYKKAILDIADLFTTSNEYNLINSCKSKKQLCTTIESLLNILLIDADARNLFMTYGNQVCYHVNPETHKVVKISKI